MDEELRRRLRRADDNYAPAERPTSRPAQRPSSSSQPLPKLSVLRAVPLDDTPAPVRKQEKRVRKSSLPSPSSKEKSSKRIKRLQKRRGKKFLTFLILLLLIGGGYGFYKYHQRLLARQQVQKVTQAAQQLGNIKPTGTIRLIASGDNLTFDSVNNAAKKPDGSYEYASLFAQIKPFFDKNKADIRICNESVPAAGTIAGISGFPNFNAPPAFAKGLADVGCNVISLGSKNINDKGQTAIDASVRYWDNQSAVLAVAGANRSAEEQAKIRYFTVKQVKFAYLSYAITSNNTQVTPFGVNMYSDATASNQISEARKNAQFVIVSMNWGTENSSDIDANQEHISQVLVDLGADVIIGSGPHVLQPVKILDGKAINGEKHQGLVWYSLGNFLNSQVPIENLIGGIAIMDIDVATQHINNPAVLPIYMHYEWTAAQKQRQSADDLAARHNLILIPLDKATDSLLASQQSGTTVQAQMDRVKAIITKSAPIKVITSSQY